jgi:hypothetical protein
MNTGCLNFRYYYDHSIVRWSLISQATSTPPMLCFLRANLISPSRHHLITVVSKAVILLKPIPIPKAVRTISRNPELAAIIR